MSPLSEEYLKQTEDIAGIQNVQKFNSFATLMQEIDKIKTAIPYKLGAT